MVRKTGANHTIQPKVSTPEQQKTAQADKAQQVQQTKLSADEIAQRASYGGLDQGVAGNLGKGDGAAGSGMLGVLQVNKDARQGGRLDDLGQRFANDADLQKVSDDMLLLGRYSAGPAVEKIQQALMDLGYEVRFGADGEFGRHTKAAVQAFQRDNGLDDDGVVGPLTLGKLDHLIHSQRPAPPPEPVEPTPPSEPVDPTPPNSPVEPTPGERLTHGRFRGDSTLEQVAAGERVLEKGALGATVRTVQQSLADLGYRLPSGVDGDFGGETQRALLAFQEDHSLRQTGKLDQATIGKLNEVATAPGVQKTSYPEYDKLFEDGVLDTTLAVGFDEGGYHHTAVYDMRAGLRERGYKRVDTSTTPPEQLREMGIDPDKIEPGVNYYHKEIQHQGEPAQHVIRFITPSSPNARQLFANGIRDSDAVAYAGHARYGTGPDFDHKESTDGNFVIGVNSQAHREGRVSPGYSEHMNHILEGQPNALETERFNQDKYQLWYFQGCTTEHYLDELRGIDYGKDRRNLDLFGTTRPLDWHDVVDSSLAFIDGIATQGSTEELRQGMSQPHVDRSNPELDAIWSDGFSGNRYQAPSRP